MAEDPLSSLRSALLQTQSPDSSVRKQAEKFLKEMENIPNYPNLLNTLIERYANSTNIEDKNLRTLAAIVFKNLIKEHWSNDDPDTMYNVLSKESREVIKGRMLHIMCTVPPEVQRQYSEALVIISKHDFPNKWPTLLPDLVTQLNSQDITILHSLLLTANSILKRFRFGFKSDELFNELSYVLKGLQEPLLVLTKRMSAFFAASADNPEMLKKILQCVRLIFRIFFSLNWQDLPEYFEDNIVQWMEQFSIYLTYSGPKPLEPAMKDEPDSLERVQAAVIENLNLYASKYDEEFKPFLSDFTAKIWNLLLTVGYKQKNDILATTCIRFLTLMVSMQSNRSLFSEEATLRQIIENIVVPNVKLRESDEELFADNPSDYIQRDMEGSDSDTRRRASKDLIRGMCKQYEEKTTQICSEYVAKLLQQYSLNPHQQWRAKDAALQLVLAVSVKSMSQNFGVSETNKYIDIMEIFSTKVLPEISMANVNALPFIRADSIKFIAVFRNQFSIEQMKSLLPPLISHLRSEHAVVATYAAIGIEKLLLVKDKRPGSNEKTYRFGKNDVQPFLEDLFTGLFQVLDNADMPDNAYVMKAIMRCLNTAQETIVPVSTIVLGKTVAYLNKICGNPSNPRFNHYLFESIAILVSKVCQTENVVIDTFESNLFPPFQQILVQDVIEFAPYVFQILAQLLELRPGSGTPGMGFSAPYTALFPPLLSPVLWERKGNVPALVRLLQAYLRKDATWLANENRIPPILGIFQKLLASRATEEYAFSLLGTVFITMSPQQLDSYVRDLFNLILNRLQAKKDLKIVRFMTLFMSVIACKYDANFLHSCLDRVQKDILFMLIKQVWLPAFDEKMILSNQEKKIFAVGMTKLATETSSPVLSQDPSLFAMLVRAILIVVAPEIEEAKIMQLNNGLIVESDKEEDEVSFDSTFSKLQFASTGIDNDPVPEIKDPNQFLARSLAHLGSLYPAKYSASLTSCLSKEQYVVLQGFLTQAGVAFQ